ncbi:hypothetical protein U27_02224 [Candidatus Vecturithrix granuli]|uniref:Uncharacterized protein n=1 Tax=Vecturithrix granuli TaxID=1499967 RepID=A0A0S6WA41_VECG1|nr:hypothetical protein U27_02224 [Candidatus Vecturithrix granuli]
MRSLSEVEGNSEWLVSTSLNEGHHLLLNHDLWMFVISTSLDDRGPVRRAKSRRDVV